MAKILIISGLVLVAAGLAWPWLVKLPLGRLPGDIIIRRDNFQIYLPITTCIIASLVVSLIVRLFRK